MGQVLAPWGTETLAAHQANDAVASMYAPGGLIGAVRPAG